MGNSYIRFSESNDDVSCLCTFPHNNRCFDNKIGYGQIRSLAYLGAMVCLLRQKEITDEDIFIPQDLPQWIKDEIDSKIPYFSDVEDED
jgi:hypothetical protein